jgi:SAM-dependent methyltransferase
LPWNDTPEYLAAVEQFIEPLRGGPFWDGMRWACTDVDRFLGFTALLTPYTILAGKRILDSGCGAAGLSLTLHQAGAAEVVGIELDEAFARLAVLRTRHLPNIDIVRNDAALLQFQPASFDLIISLHVIEHVLDVDSYLRTQAILLKPSGLMLLACPNRLWPFEAHSRLPFIHSLPRPLAKRLGRWMEKQAWVPRPLRDRGRTATLYETDFTSRSLARRLRQHGFEILNIRATEGRLRVSPQIIVVCRLPAIPSV